MACPYFYPLARFESSTWIVPPRLPLGDAFTGECRAAEASFQGECRAAEASFQPGEEKLRQVCNLGYGRGRCDRFPQNASADAVRFNLTEDAGVLIRIQYIYEKDCWPGDHGQLNCENGALESGAPGGALLHRQASAFAESYLRRRG